MSEVVATRSSGIWSFIKWGTTSIVGLASGAVLMYLTPLVNNAVKPPEPVANFGFHAQGLAVTFQNRSTSATDGWWDYGDGSPLEPFSAKQETVTHTYAKPGPYQVKLSLTNVFNEKNERTVTVNIDGSNAPPPMIEGFTVKACSESLAAPADFCITATVKNADQVIWDYGGAKPIEVSADANGQLVRWVTATDPAWYTFRLVAVSGKQTAQAESKPQFVSMPPSGDAPMAIVQVTYLDAVRVEHKSVDTNVVLYWKDGCKDNTCPVQAAYAALPDYRIADAKLNGDGKDPHLHGIPTVEISADKTKVLVSGEMIKQTGLLNSKFITQSVRVPVKVALEKKSGSSAPKSMQPMTAYVNVPGKTVIQLPWLSGGWQSTKRQVTLNLKDGESLRWSGTDMPTNKTTILKGRPVLVTGTVEANQLVLNVIDRATGKPQTAK
jgi:PKD repeat protein